MRQSDKVLVFGHGQLSSFMKDYFPEVVFGKADVRNPEEIKRDIKIYKPNIIINTAAKTSIDWCEQNKDEAFQVNTLGPLNIWNECRENDIFFIHFSSGCIYHSATYDQIYKENDTPNPKCFYSWTKVWGDNLLGKDKNLLILRPRVVISSHVSTRNTIAKWLVYSHFINDQNSVTVVEDMMPVLKKMIAKRISGTFNIVNQGTVSPLEIAKKLKEKINPEMVINETTLEKVNKNLIAQRVTTVLDTTALRTVGFELPNAEVSIDWVISQFKYNLEHDPKNMEVIALVRQQTKSKYELKQKQATTYMEKN